MKKSVISLLLAGCLLPCTLWAGGVDNKQNFSATYMGSPSKNGVIEGLDTTTYNPAGITHLNQGLSVAFHTQFISLNYDHEISGKKYGSETYPILPTMFANYKKDRWAGYVTFTGVGGGGEVEYSQGNIITNKLSSAIRTALLPLHTNLINEYAYVESYDYAVTTGFSYAVTDKLSFSAGIRYVTTERTAKLHGTVRSSYGDQLILARYDQEESSWGGVFGINYRLSDTLNFGMRYETRVKLDWETRVPSESSKTYGPLPINGAALLAQYNREDKVSYPRDLPAVLGVGLTWKLTDRLSVMPSATLYFERGADWGEKNDMVDHNAMDLAIAFGYQLNPEIKLTCGYMHTDVEVNPNNFGIIEQMSPPLDGHSVSIGMEYKITDKFLICLASMINFYESASADTAYIAPDIVLAPETNYVKRNYTLGIGFEYSFSKTP